MKPDGGPAFPGEMLIGSFQGTPVATPSGGMTLRDYFAGQALAGMIASLSHPQSNGFGLLTQPKIPMCAYEYADAMLAERAK